jgi:hypothetical protein
MAYGGIESKGGIGRQIAGALQACQAERHPDAQLGQQHCDHPEISEKEQGRAGSGMTLPVRAAARAGMSRPPPGGFFISSIHIAIYLV